MTRFHLISLSGSSAPLDVQPGWGAAEAHERLGSAHRSRSGVLHACAWGAQARIAFPLAHVDSAAHAALSSWWRAQARLAWVRSDGPRFETHVVRIGEGATPLPRRIPPAGARFSGAVSLLGVGLGAAPVRGAPFILDHALYGTLDTHNILL